METAIHEGLCRSDRFSTLGKGGIGVDTAVFDPDRLSMQEIARKRTGVGIPAGASVVGFVGRMVEEKGLLELFAALRIVRRWLPDVCLLCVGPVDLEKADAVSPEAAHQYGIADICHFLGLRQDMPELYALMDVCVLPSHREGLPRAPMEASAMKVPCIVTRIRGCRDVVEHERNGLLIEIGDVQGLADAILRVLTDRRMAREMGAEGRRLAIERFDERLVFEKVISDYLTLLKRKGLPLPTPHA
jgi:glycosyltransferase involved in cell wall biosynthesis